MDWTTSPWRMRWRATVPPRRSTETSHAERWPRLTPLARAKSVDARKGDKGARRFAHTKGDVAEQGVKPAPHLGWDDS